MSTDRQSSTRWLWYDGWEKDEPRELQGKACVSEKPLAAHCVVPAIACKALSVREESRVKCSPGPRDRCSPLPASIPALPAQEAKAERRKASGSSIPAGSPPAGQGGSKGCCQGRAASLGDVLPKTDAPGGAVGLGGKN